MMKSLLLALLTIVSIHAHADMIKLAVITSEFDDNKTDYFLETNDAGEIHSMRYVTNLPNGGISEDVTIPAEKVITEGVLLVERNGYEAVRLEVERFSMKEGGTIKLNYLYSGITGARHIKRLNLSKSSGIFKLQDDSKDINALFLVANWVRFVGIVGVREVKTSFSQKPSL
jgi:hypothetical protein